MVPLQTQMNCQFSCTWTAWSSLQSLASSPTKGILICTYIEERPKFSQSKVPLMNARSVMGDFVHNTGENGKQGLENTQIRNITMIAMVLVPSRAGDSLLRGQTAFRVILPGCDGCLQSAISTFFVTRNFEYTRTATASVATTMVKVNTK